jgi:hypothetical protein
VAPPAEETLQEVNRIMVADLMMVIAASLAIAVVRLLTKRLVARAMALVQPHKG